MPKCICEAPGDTELTYEPIWLVKSFKSLPLTLCREPCIVVLKISCTWQSLENSRRRERTNARDGTGRRRTTAWDGTGRVGSGRAYKD